MREYVTKEQNEKLPHAGRIKVQFRGWWFARAWSERSQPWRYQKLNFWMRTRGANYGQVWVGPLSIIWPARWLAGPARSLHPEAMAAASTQEGAKNG